MSNAFKTGLQARLTSTGPLNTNTGGRIYYGSAPQDTAFPYVVWNDYLTTTDLDTKNKYPTVHVQTDIYSKTASSSEIGTLSDAYETLITDCEAYLSVTGYSVIRVDHLKTMNFGIDEGGVWRTMIEHKFELQKT